MNFATFYTFTFIGIVLTLLLGIYVLPDNSYDECENKYEEMRTICIVEKQNIKVKNYDVNIGEHINYDNGIQCNLKTISVDVIYPMLSSNNKIYIFSTNPDELKSDKYGEKTCYWNGKSMPTLFKPCHHHLTPLFAFVIFFGTVILIAIWLDAIGITC
jgi:hypothetical protein